MSRQAFLKLLTALVSGIALPATSAMRVDWQGHSHLPRLDNAAVSQFLGNNLLGI